MIRSGGSVGAIALFALVGLDRSATAQSADPLPYMYLWGPPEAGVGGPTFLSHASRMVRG